MSALILTRNTTPSHPSSKSREKNEREENKGATWELNGM